MGKIVWLASYPKSGNTWTRAFLANYMADGEQPVSINELYRYFVGDGDAGPYRDCLGADRVPGTLDQLGNVREAVQKCLSEMAPGAAYIKTHNNFTLPGGRPTVVRALAFGAVYIVRNPLDIVPSFADHYGGTIDRTIEAMADPQHMIGGGEERVPQYLGGWSSHVTGWLDSGDLYRVVLRYEDMLRDPARAFGLLLQFLKAPLDREKVARAIAASSFDSLKRQEAEQDFIERSPNSERFFRRGGAGIWRESLSDAQAARVIELHGDVMRRLGYLTEDGKPVF